MLEFTFIILAILIIVVTSLIFYMLLEISDLSRNFIKSLVSIFIRPKFKEGDLVEYFSYKRTYLCVISDKSFDCDYHPSFTNWKYSYRILRKEVIQDDRRIGSPEFSFDHDPIRLVEECELTTHIPLSVKRDDILKQLCR